MYGNPADTRVRDPHMHQGFRDGRVCLGLPDILSWGCDNVPWGLLRVIAG